MLAGKLFIDAEAFYKFVWSTLRILNLAGKYKPLENLIAITNLWHDLVLQFRFLYKKCKDYSLEEILAVKYSQKTQDNSTWFSWFLWKINPGKKSATTSKLPYIFSMISTDCTKK